MTAAAKRKQETDRQREAYELLGKITHFEAPDDKSGALDMMVRIHGRTIRVPIGNQEMAALISQGVKALAGKLP